MAAPKPAVGQGLVVRTGKDGSFSLWSETFGEGFHSGRGALREARETFLNPSQLERFQPGSTIRVLEVCVGTGCNLAVLLEGCERWGLRLDWIGLELDPEPLRLALSQPAFRGAWQPQTLAVLEQLLERDGWQRTSAAAPSGSPAALCGQARAERPATDLPGGRGGPEAPADPGADPSCAWKSRGRIDWGDARQTLRQLQADAAEPFDLIWHDAFSPQRCPQLWSLEFLADLARLLGPAGRWISYCSAAAVREALRLAGLQLAALQCPASPLPPVPSPEVPLPARRTAQDGNSRAQAWSGGTLASPGPLPTSALWRELSEMERQHLACSAGEPYRDPTASTTAEQILAARQQAQAEALASGSRGSSSAWRRRWGVQASDT